MRRALRPVGGIVLAVVAMITVRPTFAGFPGLRRDSQQPQGHTVVYEETTVLSEAQSRLEEMKVELVLLADIATFPYYLGCRVTGGTVELRGYVPNPAVRQRALELARRSTFLTVTDAMQIQANLSVRATPRPAAVLQQEGAELLQTHLGEAARQITLTVRASGDVVVTGKIDSVESKREVSRLFRRLTGCVGVVNELIVQQVVRDGQRVVQVTRNGSLVVSPSVVGLETEPAVTRTSASMPAPQLPTAVPPQQPRTDAPLPTAVAPKPAPERIGCVPYKSDPAQLPVKWSSPTTGWETQVKNLEPVHAPSTSPAPSAVRSQAPPPPPDNPACHPAQTIWTRGMPTNAKPVAPSTSSRPNFAESRDLAPPPSIMTWHRPGSSEASEPNTAPAPENKEHPRSVPAKLNSLALTPATTSLSTPRHWPPAYEAQPPENKGHPGVIVFDDEAPPSKPGPKMPAAAQPKLVPAHLQHEVKAVCGRQAREVVVEPQKDGILLVRVKVANQSTEDALSRKILAIPEMTSPQVRLLMDINP